MLLHAVAHISSIDATHIRNEDMTFSKKWIVEPEICAAGNRGRSICVGHRTTKPFTTRRPTRLNNTSASAFVPGVRETRLAWGPASLPLIPSSGLWEPRERGSRLWPARGTSGVRAPFAEAAQNNVFG